MNIGERIGVKGTVVRHHDPQEGVTYGKQWYKQKIDVLVKGEKKPMTISVFDKDMVKTLKLEIGSTVSLEIERMKDRLGNPHNTLVGVISVRRSKEQIKKSKKEKRLLGLTKKLHQLENGKRPRKEREVVTVDMLPFN